MSILITLFTLIVVSFAIWCIWAINKDVSSSMMGDQDEGFETHYLQACPSGYQSSYTADGDILCCDGEVLAGKCLSDRQCVLNGKGPSNCVELLKREYQEKSATWCPPSLPHYFEDRAKKMKGCTEGLLNNTMSGPRSTSQGQCHIYSDFATNQLQKDSCYNYKLLDAAECFGKDCKKELMQVNSNAPPLVSISFTDGMGMRRTAFTKDSLISHYQKAMPDWRSKGINLDKNIMVAEVAKAVYVDKTMSPQEVQL